jgi:hypothetical protein
MFPIAVSDVGEGQRNRGWERFCCAAIFETPPGWKGSDVSNRWESFGILATEFPSFPIVPPARHRTSEGIKFSPFSALRAEGVQSPSIGSSPSIERRGTSPRSVVVASCFSVSDPTKTKSTPIVFFVYRTLSIHFRTDRAFSIPGLGAHVFINALSSFWSFSGVKSAKGWSGSTQFALGWEVPRRPCPTRGIPAKRLGLPRGIACREFRIRQRDQFP